MQHFDHVIVGGGVIGTAIAYQLARKGGKSILLVERNELASAATSRAAGLVLQVTGKAAKTPLARLTRETFPMLEDELGEAVGFHDVGSLRIAASKDRVTELNAMAVDATRHGIPVHRLSAAESTKLVPWLDPSPAHNIVFMPTDGYVDPYLLAMTYAKCARARGAVMRPRTAVVDILQEDGRVIRSRHQPDASAAHV